MLKIPLTQNKETIIGVTLFSGVAILFVVNVFLVVLSLIGAYGFQKTLPVSKTIDSSVMSDAVKLIAPEKQN